MEEHEVAAMACDLPQGQPEVSGAGTASGWGTCEELLLVSAVKRHGVHNWNLISSELKARAISLSVSPLHFSETVCKHKYDALRGRYASSSSSSMSQVEEVENDMQWCEELRKLRVAHLKRELEQYDGSIGSLQVKIKRLKAEKAQDTSLNKQLGKSIANPRSIHDVSAATSSCEVSEQLMTGLRPCSSPQQAVTALDSETTPHEQASSQAATSSQKEIVVTDTDQWHDSVEEFQETSPVSTVITVDLDVQTDPHPCGNSAQHNSTEHEEIQDNAAIFVGKEVATEPPVPVGVLGPGDGLESVEADSNEERKEFMKLPENELADSHQQDKHMVDEPAEFLPKDNEAGGIGPDSRNDGDNKKAGILEDLKICEEVSSEVEVVEDDGSVNAQVNYEQPERSRFSTAAIPASITDTGIDGCDSEHGNHQYCSTVHSSMTSSMCLLPISSQSPESRTPDEAGEPHSKVSTTEEEATTSVDDGQNVSELHEGETLEEDGVNETPVEVVNCPPPKGPDLEGYGGSQPHVVAALDTVDGHSSRVVESSTLNHAEVENTNNVYTTDVRKEHKIEDPEVTETPDDDVGRCTGRDESDRVTSQEQDLQSEVPNVGDVMDPNVLKDTTILDPGSTEAGQSLDDIAAGERVQINDEPQKLEISAIVPVASLVSSESGVIRDGTIILLNNSDPKGDIGSPAGLVYLSDALSVDRKSLSPERHIIIALDEPSNDVLSCRGRPVLASNAGGQLSCKMGSYTGSEAPDADNKKLLLENLNWSLGSNGNEAVTTSPANAMDLLREVYGTAHETTSESTIPSSTEDAAATNPSSTTLSAEVIIPDTQKAYSGDQTLLEASTKATHQLKNSEEMHVPSKDAGKDKEENDPSFAGCKEPCYASVGQLEAGDPYKVSPSSNGEESASPNLVLSLPEEECLQQVDGDSTIDPLGIRPTTANREDESAEQKFAINNMERELPGIIIDVKLDIISKDDDDAYDITTSDSKLSRVVSSDSLRGTSALKSTTNALKCRDGVEAKEEPKEEIVRKSKSHAQDSREGLLPHSIVIPKLEPSSPVESSAGGLESKMPSSHEGSDSVHEQYKDSGDERRRGGTRNYSESHVFDKSEAGSPIDGNDAMSPSSRSNRKEPRVPGKLVPLLEVLRRLCSHKSAYLFKGRQEVRKNPLASQSLSKDSRYNLLIRRHLDLTIVRARLEEGVYSSGSKEFFRDLLLIFNNAMVYYPCGSVEFEGAKSLFAEATKEMERIFQTEALLNRDGPATRTRELKKPKTVVGVAVAVPSKTVGGPPSGGASSGGKLINNPIPPVTSLPETNNRKRAGSRLGAVETSTNSGAAVESEGGAARSASVNPKVRSTTEEEAGNLQEDDQEVDGRLNDTKKLHKVGVLSRGKPPREELLEGILLKNAGGNKGTGRGAKVKDVKVLKEVKKEEVLKKVAVPAKVAAVGAKPKADKGGERVKVRVSEKEQRERDKEKGKEREDIDDDDVLRRGKSLSKVKDREVVIREREPEVIKPALKARASTAVRPTSNNSRDTLAQSLVRPSRGGRKSAVEPSRPPPELQPKKRVRKRNDQRISIRV